MSLLCTEEDWNQTVVDVCESVLAECFHVAAGACDAGLDEKLDCVAATAAGQHVMHHCQSEIWSGNPSSRNQAAETEIHLRQDFGNTIDQDDHLYATILKELLEPSPMQSSGEASTPIIDSPTCEGIPKDDPGSGSGPDLHLPEPSSIPIPNLTTYAETATIDGIPQPLDEARESSGSDKVQDVAQLASADLREEEWEKTRLAILNGTVHDNASFKVTTHDSGITLILSNLPSFLKFENLVDVMHEQGCYDNIMSFHMPRHKTKRCFSGRGRTKGRGYIFVRFDSCEAALRCFDIFNGRYFGASPRKCVVRLAYQQDADMSQAEASME